MFSGFSQQRGMILIFEHSIFSAINYSQLLESESESLAVKIVFSECIPERPIEGGVATKGRGATSTGFSNHFNDVLKSA